MALRCMDSVPAGISTELCRLQVSQIILGCNVEAWFPYCKRDLDRNVAALLSPRVLVADKTPIMITLAAS